MNAMRVLMLSAASSVFVAACGFDLRVPGDVQVQCTTNDDCPEGLACARTNLCVDAERLADAPIVFSAEPALDRDMVSCVEGFNVATMTFALSAAPVQQTITVDDTAVDLACTTDAGAVECSVPASLLGACAGEAELDVAAQGVHTVVVTAQDLLGNVARGAMSLTLDVTAPSLLTNSTQVSLFPGNDNPRRAYVILDGEALTAATDGTVATIGFGLSESAIVEAVTAGPVSLLEESLASAFVQLTPTVSSAWPEGELALEASVVDSVGNAATIDLGASVVVDRTPPTPLKPNDIQLRRHPWGTAQQPAAHLVVEGAVGATQEPLAVINVVLESGTFLQARAASDGAFAVTGVGDSRTASVVVVDAAGNASSPVDATRVQWTATLNGKVPTSAFENPNALFEVPRFDAALESPTDREARDPSAVTAIDDDAVSTSTTLAFSPRLFTSSSPTIRRRPIVGRDERRGRFITTAGAFGVTVFDNTVYSVGRNEVSVLSTSNLPARPDAMSVYDKARGVFVQFGGRVSGAVSNELWESADGSDWHERVVVGPSAREDAAVAWDESRRAMVVFGGRVGSTRLGDTWLWDGDVWQQLEGAVSPTSRSGGAMTFVPGLGTVLFGGALTDTQASNETWILDDNGWRSVSTAASPPPMSLAGLALDPQSQQTLLFGGFDPQRVGFDQTWLFNGSTWTEQRVAVHPDARFAFGLATDDDNGRVVLVGGQQNLPVVGGGFAGFRDVWEWRGSWRRLDVSRTSPPALEHRGVAYDPERREVVLFGGVIISGAVAVVNSTHTYNGLTTTAESPAFQMPGAFRSSLAAFRRGVIALPGDDTTYRWNGSNWAVAPGNPPDEEVLLVTDETNDRVLALGGGKTSRYDGTTWTAVCGTNGALCPAAGATAAFDRQRGAVVAFDGTQVMVFNGTSWVSDNVSVLPSPPGVGTLVYDVARAALLMIRTDIGGTFDVHAYQDGVFTTVPLASDPEPRTASSIVYDAANDEVAIIGGNSRERSSSIGDVLVLEPDLPPAHLFRVALASAGRGDAEVERVQLTVAAGEVDVWVWSNGAWDAVATEDVGGVLSAVVEDERAQHLAFGDDGAVFFAWTPRTVGIGSRVTTDAVSAVVEYRRPSSP